MEIGQNIEAHVLEAARIGVRHDPPPEPRGDRIAGLHVRDVLRRGANDLGKFGSAAKSLNDVVHGSHD